MWYGISSRRTEIALVKTFGSEIGVAAAASLGGGIITLMLHFGFQQSAPNGIAFTFLSSLLPMAFLQLGLNWWRLRWAKSLLSTRFRQAAAGLGP